MSAADSIARLDAALERSGADVRIYRGAAYVDCKAKVHSLSATELRTGSLSSQGQYRAILSPAKFVEQGAAVTLPLKTTDKILWNGAQRTITFAPPQTIGSEVVRIEIDFMG